MCQLPRPNRWEFSSHLVTHRNLDAAKVFGSRWIKLSVNHQMLKFHVFDRGYILSLDVVPSLWFEFLAH
jgi:hypothetical protein